MGNIKIQNISTMKHAEAFCHMVYSPKIGDDVSIWNSRDGVTAYICILNGQEYSHSKWSLDRPEKNYELRDGDMFWRDMTEKEAKILAEKRIESFRGTEYEIIEEEHRKMVYDSLVENFTGQPHLEIFKATNND